MINYDSILSAFDGKPTLLQWLKMVKKALDESVLKDVTIAKDGDNISFTFNFEDGTSVTTPKVTLPKGDKGDTGATGPKGNDGVSITRIDTVSDSVVGDRTVTTLRASYSNDTSDEFIVTAKNGKDAEGTIYSHIVHLYESNNKNNIYFKVYSNKQALTLNDIMAEIPATNSSAIRSGKRTYVCFNDLSESGVVSVAKFVSSSGNYYIYVDGVTDNGTTVKHTSKSFSVDGFDSQLLE